VNFGITPNDEGDADTGPNLLQNFPEIVDDSSVTGDQITINYFVPSSPENSAYPIQVEFFMGDGNRQGKEFLFSENFQQKISPMEGSKHPLFHYLQVRAFRKVTEF
jgi:hypothetical protein